jgi:hypothetical protein
MNPIVKP